MKSLVFFLVVLCITASAVAQEPTVPVSAPAAVTSLDSREAELLSLATELRSEVQRANVRIDKIVEDVKSIDDRVSTLEESQQKAIEQIAGLQTSQQQHLGTISQLQGQLSSALQKAAGLEGLVGQLQQQAVWLTQQAQQAAYQAQVANDAAAPRGLLGKFLSRFPRLRHEN